MILISTDQRSVLLKHEYSHVGRELTERLVEVVHLCQNADSHDNQENISAWMRKLIIAAERQLHSNAKCLDRHDRHASHRRTNTQEDHGILLAILRRNTVDHDQGEDRDEHAIE